MTYQADIAVPSEILGQIASGDWEVPPELIRIVVNAPMRQERQQHLPVWTGSKSS